MTRLCKSSSSSFLSLSLSAATSPYIRRRQLLNLDIYYAGIVVIYRGRKEEEEDPIAAVSPQRRGVEGTQYDSQNKREDC